MAGRARSRVGGWVGGGCRRGLVRVVVLGGEGGCGIPSGQAAKAQ